MTTLRAHFDGNVLVPDEPVNLPIGCPLEVSVWPVKPNKQSKAPLSSLMELAAKFPVNPDLPTDAAAQHDHYRCNDRNEEQRREELGQGIPSFRTVGRFDFYGSDRRDPEGAGSTAGVFNMSKLVE